MKTLKITVDSPQTNRHGEWTIRPAVVTGQGPKEGQPRRGWSHITEPDGYIRVCHNSVAEEVLADLRKYPHTEIAS